MSRATPRLANCLTFLRLSLGTCRQLVPYRQALRPSRFHIPAPRDPCTVQRRVLVGASGANLSTPPDFYSKFCTGTGLSGARSSFSVLLAQLQLAGAEVLSFPSSVLPISVQRSLVFLCRNCMLAKNLPCPRARSHIPAVDRSVSMYHHVTPCPLLFW